MCNGEGCRIEKGNEGPTLNHSYNDLLKRWAAGGHPSNPECEDCGCDLTGEKVFETSTMWVCEACKPEEYEPETEEEYYLETSGRCPDSGREDFHADG